MPASGCGEGKSPAVTFTSSAPLMFSPLRAYSLMPLVTVRPVSDAAATTCPPGHTQKLKALRPLGRWHDSL